MLPVEDYVGQRRDSAKERALARELRARPESERFEFIQGLMPLNTPLGLEMARTTLNEPRYFEAILDQAVRETDASSIRWYLECVVGRMGFPKTIHWLQECAADHPRGVGFARYHLLYFQDQPGYSQEKIAELPGA